MKPMPYNALMIFAAIVVAVMAGLLALTVWGAA